VGSEVKERQEGLFTRFKDYFKNVKRGYKLSSKKFSEELNDEVTRLGLYFSVLLGELNIMLNVCQMDMIGNNNTKQLLDSNIAVKSDDNFKNLLISSIIYRTLQLYNIFELCKDSASSSATKHTCSKDSINQYITEIETERTKINIVLFGKSKSDNKILFPLYAPAANPEKTDPNSHLERLRTIMRKFSNPIRDKTEAQNFLDDINKFNDKLKESSGKIGSSSVTSTDYITKDSYYIDDGKVKEEPKPYVQPDVKPLMKVDIKTTRDDSPAVQFPRLRPPPDGRKISF
jgi:hypothetical protein